MQFPGMGKPSVGLVVDTDLGSRIDDALALAVMYGLDGKNEARVVAVSVSKPNLKAAAFAEVVGRFYAGAVSGAFGSFSRTLPVGMATAPRMAEDTPMLVQPLLRKEYQHGIQKLNDTAEPVPVLRNALTAQYDQNAIMILNGPATTVAKMLALPGVKEMITAKVRYLVVSGGNFTGGDPELHIRTDVAAARKLFAEWPGPLVVAGEEIGTQILYPGASIETDFAWSNAHPIVDAYRAYRSMPYDAPTNNLAAVLYAVRPNEKYFRLSEPGTVSVDDAGRTKFTPGAGNHRHLIFDPEQKDRVLKTYIELASAKPVPRMPRFPRQQKKQAPEPPAKKQ